jgi:hypothetical protein
MIQLIMQINSNPTAGHCALCHQPIQGTAGTPQLANADTSALVCTECGRKYAPTLAALLKLGQVAERVGRMGRHTLFPPLPALLDLARVAEEYVHTLSSQRKQAA